MLLLLGDFLGKCAVLAFENRGGVSPNLIVN
jgi:hypothetical protein